MANRSSRYDCFVLWMTIISFGCFIFTMYLGSSVEPLTELRCVMAVASASFASSFIYMLVGGSDTLQLNEAAHIVLCFVVLLLCTAMLCVMLGSTMVTWFTHYYHYMG